VTHAFGVPRRFPAVNVWHGGPAWKYLKEKAAWLHEFPPSTALTRPAGRRAVTIVRVYPKAAGQKRYDPDNLKGGAKPILDALVELRWLKGDSPRHCDLTVEQRHGTTMELAPCTLVTLEDVA